MALAYSHILSPEHGKERDMEIQHFSHNHPLILKTDDVGHNDRVGCECCSKRKLELIYTCRACNHNIHKSCGELPRNINNHPFHAFHPLEMYKHGNYACCGCGKWGTGFFYWCIRCNFTLSPECALRPTLKYEFLGEGKLQFVHHQNPLVLMDVIGEDDICCACEKPCSGESYSCPNCATFKIHKSCIDELPRSIRHEAHSEHPMMLRTKDGFFDNPCVACSRRDNILTYRCSMCRFEMDPHCAVFQYDREVTTISNNLMRLDLSSGHNNPDMNCEHGNED